MFPRNTTRLSAVFYRFRFLTLIPLALLLSACAQDRYFFMERADLNPLQQQLAEQQVEITALKEQNQAQFDLLETRQQLRQNDLSAELRAQRTLLEKHQQAPLEHRSSITPQQPQSHGRYQGKLVVGELEKVYLPVPGLIYEARIDSGAQTSSLHATNIERFERDGERWVRFDIEDPKSKEPLTLERKLSRNVRIVQASAEDTERRPVIELPFMIGDHRQTAEFTLSDREHLNYPLLIGRNVLRDVMLVDVGRENATELPEGLDLAGDSDE